MPWLLLLLQAFCSGQTSTFSTEIKVVTLQATVRDADGKPIKNLTKDDFRLTEDGVPQVIRYLSRETDLPLLIGLLVDTSGSQRLVIENSRHATYAFLDAVLRPDRDEAFVLHFDLRVGVLQGFTSSREKLRSGIDKLHIPFYGGSRLFDAIKRASNDLMRPRQGRKAFIVISDGADFRGRTSIGNAIEFAQRADTIIYSIVNDYHEPDDQLPTPTVLWLAKLRGRMWRLADETGGAYFELKKTTSVAEIYAQIQDELRNQYSIGYTSNRTNGSRAYRKITLTTKKNDLKVRTRDGYYPDR